MLTMGLFSVHAAFEIARCAHVFRDIFKFTFSFPCAYGVKYGRCIDLHAEKLLMSHIFDISMKITKVESHADKTSTHFNLFLGRLLNGINSLPNRAFLVV